MPGAPLLARPQTNGRARDALGGLCQRQRRGSGSCASSSSPMALPPGSCTQCRTRGHRALRRALDHCADAASASPTPGATREPRPDLQRRPVLTSSANLRLLARRTRDRPRLFENASLLNLCPAQLPNGLERTIVLPTSVPTDRRSLPDATRFHPTGSAARGWRTTELDWTTRKARASPIVEPPCGSPSPPCAAPPSPARVWKGFLPTCRHENRSWRDR